MKWSLALLVAISIPAFAQNMATTETYEQSSIDMPDGTSRYIGKCSTHEDYYKFYYKTEKVLQRTVSPGDMEEAKIAEVIKKFDPVLVKQVLKEMELYDVAGPNESETSIFKNYVDDITVDVVKHLIFPELDLIRFNVGVGGGNGGYLIYNKVSTSYNLMSKTFDGDLSFCDKKVWLGIKH